MIPEYTDTRLKWSFVIPLAISFFSTLFKLGFWLALLITLLETFFFWVLIVFFIEIFMYLDATEREPKWKETALYSNIILLPLFLTGCLLPVVRQYRNDRFPLDNDWDTIQALASNSEYQMLVLLPNLITIITTILIILLLTIVLHTVHEFEWLKAILFAIVVGVLAFQMSTVLAGLPFGSN